MNFAPLPSNVDLQGSFRTEADNNRSHANITAVDLIQHREVAERLLDLSPAIGHKVTIDLDGEPNHYPNCLSLAFQINADNKLGDRIKERYVFAFEGGKTKIAGSLEHDKKPDEQAVFHTDITRWLFSSKWFDSTSQALDVLHGQIFEKPQNTRVASDAKQSILGEHLDLRKFTQLGEPTPGHRAF